MRTAELRLAQRLTPGGLPVGQFFNSETRHVYGTVVDFIVLLPLGRRQFTFEGEKWPTVFHEFLVLLPSTFDVVKLSFRNRSLDQGTKLEEMLPVPCTQRVFRAMSQVSTSPHGDFYTWNIVQTEQMAPKSLKIESLDFYERLAREQGVSRDEAKRRHWAKLYGASASWRLDVEDVLFGRLPQITPQWDPMPFWGLPITQAHGRMLRAGERRPFLYSADWATLEKKMFDTLTKKETPMQKFFVTVGNSFSGALGFNTLKQAADYAREKTASDGIERNIMQRVRAVRRKPQPVTVQVVK